MVEVGWSFRAAQLHGRAERSRALADLPALRLLLEEAMATLGGSRDLGEARLNVICRHYARGEGIPIHVDRKEMFEEDVYGCVLLNTSDQMLGFRRTNRAGEVLASYDVQEQAGTCFRQTGDARYVWAHGVPTTSMGDRFSVTWRWFAPEFVEGAV